MYMGKFMGCAVRMGDHKFHRAGLSSIYVLGFLVCINFKMISKMHISKVED